MRKFFCLGVLLLCTNGGGLLAQTYRTVSGTLQNPNGVALESAIIYVQSPLDSNYINFSNTNEKGQFALQVPETLTIVQLKFSSLGYEPAAFPLAFDTLPNARDLLFTLYPQSKQMSEVVVKAQRQSIKESGDTISYNLKAFRDSTEYSVEDLLKKLPGVEVSSTGAIKVNGKDIKTVLVEGENMFGRQYTMGTKNIRALAIEQVDVISRYEENPTLKGIRASDDVVLNLKISENLKNILSGTSNFGLGAATNEAKLSSHVNLFNIRKKVKSILLTDNGNASQSLSATEILATYGNPLSDDDLKEPIKLLENKTQIPTAQNPGVDKAFINNSSNTFSSVRNIFNLTKHLRLNLNGTFSYNRFRQASQQLQSYVYDPKAYALDLTQNVDIRTRVFDAEGLLTYLHPNQKSYLSVVSRIYQLNDNVGQGIFQDADALTNGFANKNQNVLFNATFSHRISENNVVQVFFKNQITASTEQSVFQNRDLALLASDDSLYQLNQRLSMPFNGTLLRGVYTHRFTKLTAQFETEWQRNHVRFERAFRFSTPSVNNTIADSSKVQGLTSHLLTQRVILTYTLPHNTALKTVLLYRNLAINDSLNPNSLNASLIVEKDHEGGKIQAGYQYVDQIRQEFAFLNVDYFRDQFYRFVPQTDNRNDTRSVLFVSYYKRNVFKSRFFNVRLNYTFNENAWKESLAFNASLLNLSPFYTVGNGRWSINGHFSQFIPSVKTKFDVMAAYGRTKSIYDIQNAPSSIVSSSFSLKSSLNIALQYYFRWEISNDFNQFNAENTNANASNRILNNNAATTFSYNLNQYRATLSLNYRTIKNGTRPADRFFTSQFSFTKSFKIQKKESNLMLVLYNLNNARTYNRSSSDDVIVYQFVVNALQPFFLLKFDLSI